MDVALSSAAGTGARRKPKPSAEHSGFDPCCAQIIGENLRRFLDACAGDRDGDTVEDKLARLGDGGLAHTVGGRRDNLLTELAGDRHLSDASKAA